MICEKCGAKMRFKEYRYPDGTLSYQTNIYYCSYCNIYYNEKQQKWYKEDG